MDKGIPNQQNLNKIELGIVLLQARSNRFEDLSPLISQVNMVLKTLKNGQLVRVKFWLFFFEHNDAIGICPFCCIIDAPNICGFGEFLVVD